MRAFLQAARAGGFKQTGVLETLLSGGDTSKRVLTVCHEACAAAGYDRIKKVMDAMTPDGAGVTKADNKNRHLLAGTGIHR